jgi:hypothetical protein
MLRRRSGSRSGSQPGPWPWRRALALAGQPIAAVGDRGQLHQRAGYDTPAYPRWAWQRAATVAAAGLEGAARGKVTVVPGLPNKAVRHLMSLAPTALVRRVDRRVRPGNRSQHT